MPNLGHTLGSEAGFQGHHGQGKGPYREQYGRDVDQTVASGGFQVGKRRGQSRDKAGWGRYTVGLRLVQGYQSHLEGSMLQRKPFKFRSHAFIGGSYGFALV